MTASSRRTSSEESPGQVELRLAAVQRRSVASCVRGLEQRRNLELAHLEALEAEHRRAWGVPPKARGVTEAEEPPGVQEEAETILAGSRGGNPLSLGGIARLLERRLRLVGLATPTAQGPGGEKEEPMTEDEVMREVWRLLGSPSPWDLMERPPMTAENLPPGFPPPPVGAYSGESVFERLFGFSYDSLIG